MNSASRHFHLRSSLALLITLSPLLAQSQSPTPSQPNSLRLERSGTGWQLRFTLAETAGSSRIVRSDHLQTLVRAGSVLATVGVAGSPRTGVIDVPTLSGSSAFFGLVVDQSTSLGAMFSPPPGMGFIPAGTFEMGSPTTEAERLSNETQHTVTLTKDFYMSQHEVTQGEYLAVMGNNPSSLFGDYPGGSETDPRGPTTGSSRAFRGGSWAIRAWQCRSAFCAAGALPGYRVNNLGFRPVLASLQP